LILEKIQQKLPIHSLPDGHSIDLLNMFKIGYTHESTVDQSAFPGSILVSLSFDSKDFEHEHYTAASIRFNLVFEERIFLFFFFKKKNENENTKHLIKFPINFQ